MFLEWTDEHPMTVYGDCGRSAQTGWHSTHERLVADSSDESTEGSIGLTLALPIPIHSGLNFGMGELYLAEFPAFGRCKPLTCFFSPEAPSELTEQELQGSPRHITTGCSLGRMFMFCRWHWEKSRVCWFIKQFTIFMQTGDTLNIIESWSLPFSICIVFRF